MSPGTRAALNAAKMRCAVAAAVVQARERGRATADHYALARRREAALRLPPLEDGLHDPLDIAA